MALIKCPDCGKEVSSKSKACIHCGCPLNSEEEKVVQKQHIVIEHASVNKSKWPKPNPDQTVFESLKHRKKSILIVWTIITIIFGIFVGIGFGIGKTGGIVFGAICASICGISALILLIGAIGIRIIIRQKDGYNICVYSGFIFHTLCIDGKIVMKSMSRNLYGELPNGKNVWVEVSIWDNSIKVGIGSDGDEKQFI